MKTTRQNPKSKRQKSHVARQTPEWTRQSQQAAKSILGDVFNAQNAEELAEIIDHETKLPDILDCLRRLCTLAYKSGLCEDDGEPNNFLEAVQEAEKHLQS